MEPTKDLNQFISDWTQKIDRIISSFGFRAEDLEDVRQDIFVRIHSKNFLDGYDETRGAFSTYIYGLVLNMLRKEYGRNKRNPLKKAQSMDEIIRNEDGDGFLFIDMIPGEDGFDAIVRGEFERQVVVVQEYLKTLPNPRGEVVGPDGITRQRSLSQIFEFILQGKDRQDMAYLLRYSEGSISLLFKQLRNVGPMKKLNCVLK